MYIISIYSYLD